MRKLVGELMAETPLARLTKVLRHLGIATSSWYRRGVASPQRPGPAPQPVPEEVEQVVLSMAKSNPWYGYKRIAVMCRRAAYSTDSGRPVHAIPAT